MVGLDRISMHPHTVREYIDNATKKNGEPLAPASRNKLAFAYDNLCRANGIKWKKPYYKVSENVPLIPTRETVTKIIASCKKDYRTILRARIKICQRRIVRINDSKYSSNRRARAFLEC